MNPTPAFTPTLKQKLLGRNYKWWYFTIYNINIAQAGIYATIIGQFANFANSFTLIYIWLRAANSKEIVTYLVIGQIYRSLVQTFWNEKISTDIVSGKIINLLLVPQNYLQYNFYANLGQRIVRNIGLILTSILVMLVFLNYIQFRLELNLIYILVLVPISFALNYFLNIAVGFLAFFLKDARDYRSTSNSILTVLMILSGTIIPLGQLPFGLLGYVQLLPTAWLLHHPMQIYLGKYSALETLYVFLGGIIWCLVLYFLAKWVFRVGLKRNESVGL